ncbi:MAG: VOC family protein [Hamadaea sp.]|uniref:VOC family protein n=1 Tax=Hamadaea sp. TaxID=2024425 RepID=UPI0017ADF8DB|nr:VOC family protein [Hamadaea sp.]NUR72730.1 VOC family protein [Hamadaea sp.]NUT18436.1 VOC family protein [Hamadaea sp.]
MSTVVGIVLDCRNAARLARFWEVALGWQIRAYDEDEVAKLAAIGRTPETDPMVAIDSPDGTVVFHLQEVPEPKAGKNRMHIDIPLRDEAHLNELFRLGATVVAEYDGWRTLADPEGNEFCVTVPN